jgi:hypothetical protein
MKGFGIEIKNNLLDPKHIEHMGIAVWLYMWCIDKMTSIDESGVGKVLGGKPIEYKEVGDELGISVRTYRRWVTQLRDAGYINTKLTPHGLIFSVNKAHKRFGQRYAENGTPSTESSAESGTRKGVPEAAQGEDKNGTRNKTSTVDKTVRQNKKNPARSADEEKKIADVIEAFKDVNPSYKTLFPRSPQREAAWRLMQQFGYARLITEMIPYLRHSNAVRYAPTITTPVQLESKLGELKAWADKQRDASGGKGRKIISAVK